MENVPYEILREIFLHCLPRYTLNYRQPDTTIAPMLLCRVCSSWRIVALTTRALWSHLSYRSVIRITHDRNSELMPRGLIAVEAEMDFIQWWRKNQGTVVPFLRLTIREPYVGGAGCKYQDLRLPQETVDYFLDYLISARYLDLDIFFWILIENEMKRGKRILFPQLRTLARSGGHKDDNADRHYFYRIQDIVSTQSLPAMQHLFVHGDMLPDDGLIPRNWSKLTHIALSDILLPATFWFAFIRAVPNLQWGYFDIRAISRIGSYHQLAMCTLSQLSTLVFIINDIRQDIQQYFPFSLLFTKLSLPALHTLSLFSIAPSWGNTHATTELYNVLRATPAITTLALGSHFLSFDIDGCNTSNLTKRDVERLWDYVPFLVYLQLECVKPKLGNEAAKAVDVFFRDAFFFGNWLDLANPSCPIRKVTIIGIKSANPRLDSAIAMRLLEHSTKLPKVAFSFTSDKSKRIVEDARREWRAWASIRG